LHEQAYSFIALMRSGIFLQPFQQPLFSPKEFCDGGHLKRFCDSGHLMNLQSLREAKGPSDATADYRNQARRRGAWFDVVVQDPLGLFQSLKESVLDSVILF
jgi:hypothetical protein